MIAGFTVFMKINTKPHASWDWFDFLNNLTCRRIVHLLLCAYDQKWKHLKEEIFSINGIHWPNFIPFYFILPFIHSFSLSFFFKHLNWGIACCEVQTSLKKTLIIKKKWRSLRAKIYIYDTVSIYNPVLCILFFFNMTFWCKICDVPYITIWSNYPWHGYKPKIPNYIKTILTKKNKKNQIQPTPPQPLHPKRCISEWAIAAAMAEHDHGMALRLHL